MKHIIIYFFLFSIGLTSSAQNIHLQLTGNSISETKVIDSLNYISKHKNAKSVSDELGSVVEKLSKIGFIANKIVFETKINDSTYNAKINLGERITSIHIYLDANSILSELLFPNNPKDTLIIAYTETEAFLNRSQKLLDQKGYSFSKLYLTQFQKKDYKLIATLKIESENLRKLNSIVVNYDKTKQNDIFPKGNLAQINRKYKNQLFNPVLLSKIHDDFEKYNFITQIKYPEILFTKDSTKVYVYLEKAKSNTFDGFIGFNNNDSKKLTFNGYLDLNLQNTLKVGEQFSLYWKSDGNKQKTFKTALELPYIFKSPLGIRGQLNIFKQDSIFQNTKTALDLSYYLNYNGRIYLGYQSTISSDIQNTNNTIIADFRNSYLTAELTYLKIDNRSSLFHNKTNLDIKTGIGKREISNGTENTIKTPQFYIDFFAMHTFYLNNKNAINIRSQNYYLKSATYITNELFRFGGINSIRGFTENSLQANFMTAILTEYRYLVSPTLYLHTIFDYSILRDATLKKQPSAKTTLLGLGFGLGVKTNNGLLKISIVTGSQTDQTLKFSNTIIQLSYGVNF
ncbi:hypothetical protein [Flavobacterium frigoris]|uniref:Uncharacterized protein n=1 Tax=Flavobacterium frigoris (strain PS1) TaxID=1086011 RepID=H7FMC5_FLAFP|nr:hypothetical protein [Flavobacterium frigoris]EIA10299.1 hypothetical protein HJ01_00394 [Flavobacterium frigoris PS1]